jgi:protein-S-isoprenylcysteine O-methyltransferase Ste14
VTGRTPARLPDLGSRGEGWVALQVASLLGLAVAASVGRPWPDAGTPLRVATGALVLIAGAVLASAGSRTLGSSLTPLPRPREGASFRDDGVYRLVRHPIYGGVLLIAVGVSLLTSPVALAPTALLVVLFEGKTRREEAWLLDRYEEYEEYRERVRRRFLPRPW